MRAFFDSFKWRGAALALAAFVGSPSEISYSCTLSIRSLSDESSPENFSLDLRSIEKMIAQKRAGTWNPERAQMILTAKGKIKLERKLGQGISGVVFCIEGCKSIVKIPRNEEGLESLVEEAANESKLRSAGFHTAKILNSPENLRKSDLTYLEKEFIDGENLRNILDRKGLTRRLSELLAETFIRSYQTKLGVDMEMAENWIYDATRDRLILVDNHFPKYLILGTEFPHIYKWRNLFGSNEEDLQFFNHQILAGIGADAVEDLINKANSARSLSHDMRADRLIWGFDP